MLTYAQNFEDVLLARAFQGRSTGFYIDIGASHPEHLSVTKHFYDRGWRGVNVEPIPRAFQRFVEARPRDVNLNVAVGRARGEREFFECSDFDALSTFDPAQAEFLRRQGHTIVSYPVKSVTCDDVFEAAGDVEVDFLKIDVEGGEQEVIESLDLARHRPKIILLEAMAPGRAFPGWHDLESVENWAQWEPRILAAHYRFVHFDGVSRFYVREDVAHLAQVFRLPVGMFDDVHFPEEARLQRREADLLAHAAGLQRHIDALEKHVRVEFARTRKLEADRARAGTAPASPDGDRLREELAEARAALKAQREMPWWPAVRFAAYRFKVTVRDAIFGAVWTFARGRAEGPPPPMTVVATVRDAGASVAGMLESVMGQEYPSLQFIVVDRGSTDGTLEVVREYATRADLPQRIAAVLSIPAAAAHAGFAEGFGHATGEVLVAIDGDDLLEPGALAAVGRHFNLHPRAGAIFHDELLLECGWRFAGAPLPRRVTVEHLLRGQHLPRASVFFRRELYRLAGGFRGDFPLAADHDLWLRMCALGRFERRAGHASCRRVGASGPGPGDPATERQRARDAFLRDKGPIDRWRWRLVHALAGLRGGNPEPFHYPRDPGEGLPEDKRAPPQPGLEVPRGAIDGRTPGRFLFTTPDTRFGDPELNYIYYDDRHGVATCYPPISRERLDALYRRHYSAPAGETGAARGASPYRGFDRRGPDDRRCFESSSAPLPSLADNTLEELVRTLRAAGLDPQAPLRVLDAGCFDGALLDRLRDETAWRGAGLEPNLHASEVARAKGHEVWTSHAEDALVAVPADRTFDVIFLGQTIEHFDDPLRVLRRLRLLLAPGGAVVCSTPSLDSQLLQWFGPTWTHWHAPFHRHLFSVRGFRGLAAAAGLHVRVLRTVSHPYWTAMTLAQSGYGVAGHVPHDAKFDPPVELAARNYAAWAASHADPQGRGDCLFVAMTEDERG